MRFLHAFFLGLIFLSIPCCSRSHLASTTERKAELPRSADVDDTLTMQFGYYYQNDGSRDHGGNPALDERESVYEGIIVLDKTLSERDRLNVRFLADIVSSASIAKYNKPMYRALQSNPSGNKHGELGVGWKHQFEKFSAGLNASFGAEASVYFSGGYGASFAIPFNHDNSTLSFLFQGYRDYFQNKTFTGVNMGYEGRNTYTGELGFTQVLTPKTVVHFNFSHTEQIGFLATSYQSVFVNGFETFEYVPDHRRRDAITTRVKQALSEQNAVELGYRYYNDSWKINSHTIDSRFLQYVWGKRLLLEPNYRYYTQSNAYFHQVVFGQFFPFMTSDPDLGDFHSHIMGIKTTLINPSFLPLGPADLDLTFNYFLRSDDLNGYWTTIGYALKF